jgi:hypothetical protein
MPRKTSSFAKASEDNLRRNVDITGDSLRLLKDGLPTVAQM